MKSRFASPWPFFALTFAWSWSFWVPTALWAPDATHLITQLGFGLGGLGPMVFGVYFTYREGGPQTRKDYWARVVDGKRLGLGGWFLSLLIVPILTLLAGELDRLTGGNGLRFDLATPHYFSGFLPLPIAIIVFLAFMILFGPFPEELGWRGYALDRLRSRFGSLRASLILGFLWGLWHLPLFFLKDAYQATLGIWTPGFFLFFAGIVPVSIVMTWIYDLTRRSILSAILFHFSINLVGTLAAHGNRMEFFRVLFCWIWAVGITAF